MAVKRYPRRILATACVPWTEDFQFDEAMFRKEVRMLCEKGMEAIYLFGTAGEGYSVSHGQYKQIVSAFMDEMKGTNVDPIVGVISLSAMDVIDRVQMGIDLGVNMFQISFPSWGAVSNSEAMTFMHMICDRFPEQKFMHYNNGGRSKTKLQAEDYARLAEEIPNLVAVKAAGATPDEIDAIMKLDSPLQFFFLEGAYGRASLQGEASLLISLLNISYNKAHAYYQAGIRQDAEALKVLDAENALCGAQLKLVPGGKMDGAYDKILVKFTIPEFPSACIRPMRV